MADTLTNDPMSPAASPGTLTKRTGVRRVNNLPLFLVGGVVLAFLVIIVMVAADRSSQQRKPAQTLTGKGASSNMYAAEIAGNQKDGIIPPADTLKFISGSEPILIARPDNLDLPPKPPGSVGAGQLQPGSDDELNRIRQAKLQQFEEAVKAKTSVQVSSPRSAGSRASGTPVTREDALAQIAAARRQIDAVNRDDPTAAYKARLAQIQSSGLISGESSNVAVPQLSQASAAPAKNSVNQFAGSAQSDRWRLESKPEPPRTPYELRAGFVVPATLISGINSDLPGQIVAQVAQHVYDTPTGKHLLIPQGSRLVGSYSSDVAYGQSRVLVAWQRIVFPDGKAMDIGAMPGADGAGQAGFADAANNHYIRLFGSALLMSAVTAGITYSQRQNENASRNAPSATSALSEALGQQLGQVTGQLIAKNINVAPTLEIRPGYRFNVIVVKDLTFSKPYKSFDY